MNEQIRRATDEAEAALAFLLAIVLFFVVIWLI